VIQYEYFELHFILMFTNIQTKIHFQIN